MRGGPWNLLHLDAQVGVSAFEFGNESADLIAFATKRPEADELSIVPCRARARGKGEER